MLTSGLGDAGCLSILRDFTTSPLRRRLHGVHIHHLKSLCSLVLIGGWGHSIQAWFSDSGALRPDPLLSQHRKRDPHKAINSVVITSHHRQDLVKLLLSKINIYCRGLRSGLTQKRDCLASVFAPSHGISWVKETSVFMGTPLSKHTKKDRSNTTQNALVPYQEWDRCSIKYTRHVKSELFLLWQPPMIRLAHTHGIPSGVAWLGERVLPKCNPNAVNKSL